MHPFNAVVLLAACTLPPLLLAAAAAQGFVYASCSPSKFAPGTPFDTNLGFLLHSIALSALNANYNSFTVGDITAGPGTVAYGLYQCRGDANPDDCVSCTQAAIAQLTAVCPMASAASVQLDLCFVRYDTDDFFGRTDTTTAFRKCSTASSADDQFLQWRDDVFAEVQTAVGFKTSSSGIVQGNGQCVGDLSQDECAACLRQAVEQLKSLCAASMSAQIFLAQCSIEYWETGYYHTPIDNAGDDTGRNLAIIFGGLAGAAIVVLVVAFLRKICN